MPPNEGMLSGEALRTKRDEVDTGTGIQRLDQGRTEHLSRGDFVNFYDDLGISTTQWQADEMRAQEAAFQGAKADQEGVLSSAQGKYESAEGDIADQQALLDKAYKDMPEFQTALDDSWGEHKNTLTNFSVVDKNNNVLGSYYLPDKVGENFMGQPGVWGNKVDGTFYVGTKGGEAYEALMTSLDTGALEYRTQYMSQAGPAIAKQLGIGLSSLGDASSKLQAARTDVELYGGQVDTARRDLGNTVAARDQQWADIHGEYQSRLDTMKEVFGGLNAERKY